MTKTERDGIDRFLESLQKTARGRAIAVNMLHSQAEGLISRDNLRDFLLDCVETSFSRSAPNALVVLEDVSCGRGSGGRSYLRQGRQTQFSTATAEQLSNCMKTESFSRFILGRKYKAPISGIPVVLAPVPASSPSGVRDYQKRLATITADPAWYETVATIGRPLPEPSNCWLTTDQFGPDPSAPSYAGDIATEARDELGLVDHPEGSFLLRLSFPASDVAKVPKCEVARPTFCDLGNSRFRVRQSSPRAAHFAAKGWGATVHLGKFGDNSFADATGVCERVTSSLAIAALGGLRIELLGRVSGNRCVTPSKDDDDVFAADLQGAQTEKEVRDSLLLLLD